LGNVVAVRTIFVSLDTVGTRSLPLFGGSGARTPNLEAFGRDAAVFTEAYASDIPTQPSHTALFTGRFGLNSGIVSHFHPPARLDEDCGWLPSLYSGLGRPTGAVDHLFAMKEWFIRGYDDYMAPPGRSRSPGSVVNEIGFDWIDRRAGEDFFLFLHFWDAHIPYVPPEPFKSEYTLGLRAVDPDLEDKLRTRPTYPLFKRNLYDHLDSMPNLDYIEALHYAEVAYLDFELGRLFDHLERRGILDDSMIVLFGDHGENMTEHDAWFDHAGLYDSVVHVPLVIRAPGVVPAGRHDALVQLVDVLPTVLEYQELAAPPSFNGMDGRSLRPLIEGQRSEHRPWVTLSEATWQAKRGIRTRDWKYIRTWDPGVYDRRRPELYHLPTDPHEQRDVAADHPAQVAELDSLLERWMAATLEGRPDAMEEVVEHGLPAVRRLEGVIAEDIAAESVRQLEIDLRDGVMASADRPAG
jgi:arylsulfatase